MAYYDDILSSFLHPVALAPNPVIGYTPSPAQVAAVADKYHQVVAVNLASTTDTYFINLKDALKRDIEIYVPYSAAMETLSLGATANRTKSEILAQIADL